MLGELYVVFEDEDVVQVQANCIFDDSQVAHKAASGANAGEAIFFVGLHRLKKTGFVVIDVKTVTAELFHRFYAAVLSGWNIDDSGLIKVVNHVHPSGPQWNSVHRALGGRQQVQGLFKFIQVDFEAIAIRSAHHEGKMLFVAVGQVFVEADKAIRRL
ncbi:hypothetical protein D3C77_483050 [compost metagenome]